MRSAESRVLAVESVDATADTVRDVYERFSVPRSYVRAGLAMGAGVVGMWMLSRIFAAGNRRVNDVVNAGAGATRSAGGAALLLLVQVASAVLLPMVRDRLRGVELGGALKRMSPSHILFRWLGLEK